MGEETVTFEGSTGAPLSAILHRPEGGIAGSALLVHCFTCSKDLHTTSRVARGLSDAGYLVLRFDFTGIGDSGGRFEDKTVSNNIRDIVRAAQHLIAAANGPCAIVGHSLGGAAALLAASKLHTIRSVVTIGAPATVDHVRRLLADDAEEILSEGRALVDIGGRRFQITSEFVDDLAEHDEQGALRDLDRPLLVVHAVDDAVVEIAEGERIFATAGQPKAFVPLLEGDHLLTDRSVSERVVDLVVLWLRGTLDGPRTASTERNSR